MGDSKRLFVSTSLLTLILGAPLGGSSSYSEKKILLRKSFNLAWV